jgi:soluble lytic murein transglycosylase-like protein
MEILAFVALIVGVAYIMTKKTPIMGIGSPAYDSTVCVIFPDAVEAWRELATQIAHSHGLSATLTLAVIWQESSGDATAFNGDIGTKGLMQIGILAAKDAGEDYADLYNPRVNIEAGTKYLVRLYRATGDWTTALQAYNGGLGNVRRGRISSRAVAYAEAVKSKAGYEEFQA